MKKIDVLKQKKSISIYFISLIIAMFILTGCNDGNKSFISNATSKIEVTKENQTHNDLNKKGTSDNNVSNSWTKQSVVRRIVDGDTIELKSGQIVRLINVNTPESTNKIERYGKEASQFTKKMLLGKTVWLTKDRSETDRYGRLLRFVWLKKPATFSEREFRKTCFNSILVLKGYAMSYSYKPDITYATYFRKFDREAHDKKVGLWQFGDKGTTKGDFSDNKNLITDKNSLYLPKIPSSESIVYFTPNGKSYHLLKNCQTLSRSKTILSGTLSEAITKGHQDPCNFCVK